MHEAGFEVLAANPSSDGEASFIQRVKVIVKDDMITITDLSSAISSSQIPDPHGKEYKLMEKTIRETWGTATC